MFCQPKYLKCVYRQGPKKLQKHDTVTDLLTADKLWRAFQRRVSRVLTTCSQFFIFLNAFKINSTFFSWKGPRPGPHPPWQNSGPLGPGLGPVRPRPSLAKVLRHLVPTMGSKKPEHSNPCVCVVLGKKWSAVCDL